MPRACALGLIAIFGYLLIYHFRHERRDAYHLGDFPTFYQAAQLARAHGNIYLAAASPSQPYVYPPLIAFVYVPLTIFSKLHAAEAMLFLTAAMLAGSLLLGSKATIQRLGCVRPGTMLIAAFCVALLNENEMRGEMTMLETDALILLLFTLALWWLDRRPTLAGLALAVIMNIKYLSIVALPYLLLRRRWRAAGSMVVGTVGFALLPAALLGWHENLRGLRISLGGIGTWLGFSPPQIAPGRLIMVHSVTDTLSLSVTSAFARVCGFQSGHTKLALTLTALTAIAAFAVAWSTYREHRLPMWTWPASNHQRQPPYRQLIAVEWAGIVAGSLVFSPDTNSRHLVLAVLVNCLAMAVLLTARRPAQRWLAAGGAIVILVGMISPIRAVGPGFYFHYGIPSWGLLIGYLMILVSAVGCIGFAGAPARREAAAANKLAS